MIDDETPEQEPVEDGATDEDAPAEEGAPAEEVPAEQAAQPAEEVTPTEEAEPATEAPADDAGAEAPAEDAAQEPAAERPPAERRPPAPEPAAKKKDVVPGADLTPIAITEERELSAEERAALEAEEEERRAREAAEAAADEADDVVAPKRTVTLDEGKMIQATGKRKSSVARVVLRRGEGSFAVNERPLDEYFPRPSDQTIARQALTISGYDSSLDVKVRVHGGGISGQAGAVRHGIARALIELDPELRAELKRRGLLTRDAREKERRKAGLKKARKKPQFSKR